MHKILLLISFIVISVSASAQYAPEKKTAYIANSYNAPGLKMKRTGTTLTVVGGALLVGGVILVSNASALYYNSSNTNGTTTSSGDPKGGFGILMVVGGVAMIVPGVILMSKGSKKYNQYKEEQKLSLGIRGAGLSLKYSF